MSKQKTASGRARPRRNMTNLRAWREKQGLTLDQAGARVGISGSHFSEIENGGTCTLKVAAAIERETEGLVTGAEIWGDHQRFSRQPQRSRGVEERAE